ncbi:hypothetical protein CRG98_043647 [Punica granatum]|uniref:Uncharacterized protein n=1 Tax=Punica granatum TaxID=22663 RepID=A0A2I0HW84_PUNGR|nr:hypothetical protein CRG98_043647 [Punica granatum]
MARESQEELSATSLEEASGGLLMQGQWLLTPQRSTEVAMVVVLREVTRVDLICKKSWVAVTGKRLCFGVVQGLDDLGLLLLLERIWEALLEKSEEARDSIDYAFDFRGSLERRIINGMFAWPGTQKSVLLCLDYRSEVVCFCRLFAPLRAVLLMSACFVPWAEQLTRRPWLEVDNRRHPRDPRTGLSQCFPSVLTCSEATAISVCQKRVPKAC